MFGYGPKKKREKTNKQDFQGKARRCKIHTVSITNDTRPF